MTVDKRDLVDEAARRSGLTRAQTRQALDAILAAMTAALADGDEVAFRDFGRFSTRPRRQTVRGFDGTRYQVESRQLYFSASAALRRRLREIPCDD
jgi:nucleoid DNA-binding protein